MAFCNGSMTSWAKSEFLGGFFCGKLLISPKYGDFNKHGRVDGDMMEI